MNEPGYVKPWRSLDACTGDPCTCPKPETQQQANARRLWWFTTEELQAEIDRRAGTR